LTKPSSEQEVDVSIYAKREQKEPRALTLNELIPNQAYSYGKSSTIYIMSNDAKYMVCIDDKEHKVRVGRLEEFTVVDPVFFPVEVEAIIKA
jgi:hypothetical protein